IFCEVWQRFKPARQIITPIAHGAAAKGQMFVGLGQNMGYGQFGPEQRQRVFLAHFSMVLSGYLCAVAMGSQSYPGASGNNVEPASQALRMRAVEPHRT